MIQLIAGKRGSGKTKTLISMTNDAALNSDGHVVCLEKGATLTYDVSHKARLVDMDEYGVAGFDALFGFLAGLMAGNYDITDIFVDATFKIGGPEKDYEGFAVMVDKLRALPSIDHVKLTFTVSCDESDLPERVRSLIIHAH